MQYEAVQGEGIEFPMFVLAGTHELLHCCAVSTISLSGSVTSRLWIAEVIENPLNTLIEKWLRFRVVCCKKLRDGI